MKLLSKSLIITVIILAANLMIAQPPVTDHIHIDQFGYRPNATKVAIISEPQTGYNAPAPFTPATTYEIREFGSGTPVFSADITTWNGGNTHSQSGDKVWWFDFTGLTTSGDYYVYDPTNNVRSYQFSIGDNVYDDVLVQAMRTYYYQRCGTPKAAPYAEGGWTDGTCHNGAHQDLACRLVTDSNNAATEKDLSGGWHDAGDYNKYINYTYEPMHDLLAAYDENPSIWGDDYNIPESGNGIPDILDELKWELDWLLKMQLTDGSALMKLSVPEWQVSSPPSTDDTPRYYAPPQASATRVIASIFAHAAIIFQPFDATYAALLLQHAELAWSWVATNPAYSDYDNAGFTSSNPEISHYRQDAVLLSAAVYLFAATGNTDYRDYFDNHYTTFQFLDWTYWYPFEGTFQDAALYYTALPNATSSVADDIKSNCANSVSSNNTALLPAFVNQTDAYRSFLDDDDYTWGSNEIKSNMGTIYADMNIFNIDPANATNYATAAEEYIHFTHGANPINLVMLSNMNAHGAENSCNEIYHGWFHDGTPFDNAQTSTYGPAPGFLTGGFNPTFAPDDSYEGTIEPPQNQPIQKSYKDWNTSHPENSWEITENSITYQASYIRLLSKFVGGSFPLPVEMLQQLQARQRDYNRIELTWTTATEDQNSGFEIQRSKDAKTWVKIGRVTGKMQTTQNSAYVFYDKNPLNSINYYRLKQIDFSSDNDFSKIVSIRFNRQHISFHPNPTTGTVQIKCEGCEKAKMTTYLIKNTLGLTVKQGKITPELHLDGLSKGLYFITVFDRNGNRIGDISRIIID